MFGMRGKKMSEGMISRISQDEFANIIRDAGYKAVVTPVDNGDAFIESANTGWRTIITFFNKLEGKYSSLQFNIWLTDNERALSLAKMNEFNTKWRFMKCSIDVRDNSIALQMDVDLDGGVSREFLANRPPLWDGLVRSFRDFMAEKQL